MSSVPGLSTKLQQALQFELERGNSIERIEQPAGTKCPLAVVLAKPLDIAGFKSAHGLPPGVETWESRDRHYPVQAGYVCERTRHALAGPI
jgi:hypothetical protein